MAAKKKKAAPKRRASKSAVPINDEKVREIALKSVQDLIPPAMWLLTALIVARDAVSRNAPNAANHLSSVGGAIKDLQKALGPKVDLGA